MSEPTRAEIYNLAAMAGADPRTVAKFLRGEKVRPGLLLDRLNDGARALSMVPRPRDGETPQPEAGKPSP